MQPPYKEWRPDLNQRKCLSSELGQPVSPDDFPTEQGRTEGVGKGALEMADFAAKRNMFDQWEL